MTKGGAETEAVLRSAIRENDAHAHHVVRSRGLTASFFPLTEPALGRLTDEQVGYVDQLIYRFSKMQDSLGMRLLPALYRLLEGDDEPRPFLDILNRLERLDVLTVDNWQTFRNLRNQLAHEYPDRREQTVQTLNVLYADMDAFLELYQKVRAVVSGRLHDIGR
mgnify:CR=1 FL=1